MLLNNQPRVAAAHRRLGEKSRIGRSRETRRELDGRIPYLRGRDFSEFLVASWKFQST